MIEVVGMHLIAKQHLHMVSFIHSKLLKITLVATKVHVILRSFVVLTWMRDKRGLVCDVME